MSAACAILAVGEVSPVQHHEKCPAKRHAKWQHVNECGTCDILRREEAV
jgi:hypothetical protein